MNVVSTVPSATEILYALGIEPVAVSHECDFPAAALDKPVVTSTSVSSGSSSEIDDEVRDKSPIYDVDREALADTDPDLVVTQDTCHDCGVSIRSVKMALEDIDPDPMILSLETRCLDDVFGNIERIGDAVERGDRAAEVVGDLRGRTDFLAEKTSGVERPDTLVLEWMDPVMSAGYWTPELVEVAGGEPVMMDRGAAPRLEWRDVVDRDPDVLVMAPCGYGTAETVRRFDELSRRPGWSGLSAVERDRFYVMDGTSYFSRPGIQLFDGVEYLACILHPDVFGEPPVSEVQTPVKIR